MEDPQEDKEEEAPTKEEDRDLGIRTSQNSNSIHRAVAGNNKLPLKQSRSTSCNTSKRPMNRVMKSPNPLEK